MKMDLRYYDKITHKKSDHLTKIRGDHWSADVFSMELGFTKDNTIHTIGDFTLEDLKSLRKEVRKAIKELK